MSKKTRAELVETLEISLRTDEWSFDNCFAIHSSGLKIWVQGGWVWLKIMEPTQITLTYVDAHRIYQAVKIARDNFLCRIAVNASRQALMAYLITLVL